ncbi:hypothetical protein TNCV_1958691 [Trichonephila clavipes]|nr:hypothetical protein TNCV_1958691 [Trichonephila clavipes]
MSSRSTILLPNTGPGISSAVEKLSFPNFEQQAVHSGTAEVLFFFEVKDSSGKEMSSVKTETLNFACSFIYKEDRKCQEIKYIDFAVDVVRVENDIPYLFGTVMVSDNRQQWSSDIFMGGANF